MYDSDYSGLADDLPRPIRCRCNGIPVKNVAFEGCWTGRRFLSCAGEDGQSCGFVHWVDDAWPDSLCKSLNELWDKYEQVKEGRVGDALRHVEEKFKYQDQIKKLQADLSKAQAELKVVTEEKQVTLALKAKAEQAMIEAKAELEERRKLDASTCNINKCLRLKAEKDRDRYKDEKRKAEHMVVELLSQKERARNKIKKMKELFDTIYD